MCQFVEIQVVFPIALTLVIRESMHLACLASVLVQCFVLQRVTYIDLVN